MMMLRKSERALVTLATDTTQLDTGLEAIADTLRQATQAEHTRAERSDFIVSLMSGTEDAEAYGRYLVQLAHLYAALEGADLAIAPAFLADPRLPRLAHIEHDLAQLGVTDWRAEPVVAAATDYADHIATVAPDWLRYTAHHYTRYLGDLSGGQVIARMLAQHYGFDADRLSFYRFEDIAKSVPFKRRYRAALADFVGTRERLDILIQETKLAYNATTAIFEELRAG